MRTLIALMLIAALAIPAMAGNNPDVRFFIDFLPDTYTHSVMPAAYTSVPAYVMADQIVGFTTVSFALSVTPGMSSPPAFTSLLPGGLAIGAWDTGITLASTDCMTVEPVQIGRLDLFYLGTPGDVMIVDHPDYPRWVVDCQEPGVVDYYCVLSHGGVGKDALAGDCGASPVEDGSWSSIKALYR